MKKFMESKNRVRRARASDAKYLLALARKFSNAVGFLPAAAIEARIAAGTVLMATENGEPAGYILSADRLDSARQIRPIFQAAIQMDAQRKHHGLQLLNTIAIAARAAGRTCLQAKCRTDLEANAFWKEAGFIAVAVEDTAAQRGLSKIIWRMPLVTQSPATLMEISHNPRCQTGGGRSVKKHDHDRLPCIDSYAAESIHLELERLGLAS